MPYAKRNTFIRRSWKNAPGDKEEKEMTSRLEEEIPVSGLLRDLEGNAEASVTSSISTKVSDAVHWGGGTWDKIPYSVEVFTSVTVGCAQQADAIQMAQRMAHDLAWQASRESIGKSVVGHAMDIKDRLFPHMFSDEEGE